MQHSERFCLHHGNTGVYLIFGIVLLFIYLLLTIVSIAGNVNEWKYYSKYYKTLKDKKFTLTASECFVWSTQDGILPEYVNGISFNTDSEVVRTNDFLLTNRFPECLDSYQLYWWYKYWHYYKKHVKPTL